MNGTSMLTSFRAGLRSTLESRGFRIERIPETGSLVGAPRRDLKDSYLLLHDLGIHPATIIDVGAASGTPELMEAFDSAAVVMVEPLQEFQRDLSSISSLRKSVVIYAAAGSHTGSTTFFVHADSLEGSSTLQEAMGEFADGESRTVPLVRLDEAFDRNEFPGPYFLKIDVQGGELEVMAGATGLLNETLVVALEVSLFSFMKNGPQFTEVVRVMDAYGFVAWDIIPGWTRPLDKALGQVDIIFVPKDSQLRANHSFATKEQYETLAKARN